ncbi:hypothetical protein D5T40_21665 [Salmonella enterica]|nr:hypothetical protein [Salmonella enterica]EAS3463359.1 hypothetical protein [Salmonella enterica]
MKTTANFINTAIFVTVPKILPEQSVSIFIRAALLGGVRITEVNLNIRMLKSSYPDLNHNKLVFFTSFSYMEFE